jgi:hypothetical protein
LFAIRKVGQRKTLSGQRRTLSSQRKTLSGQRKTLSSQRKIWFSFQESVFPLAVFVFRKVVSRKPLSKLSCVCLPLEKLVNGKHFLVKEKFGSVFRKMFFLFPRCEKEIYKKIILLINIHSNQNDFLDYGFATCTARASDPL